MSPVVYRTLTVLCELVQALPIGTNLGLLHVLLALLSGQLLLTRGALFPALDAVGLAPAAVRRAWSALATGQWVCAQLLGAWQRLVQRENRWHAHVYGGYHVVAIDTTAFFRPCLHDCPTKHFHPQAGKALPAITLALVGRVGSVDQQRLVVPLAVVRANPHDPSESALQRQAIAAAAHLVTATDRVVVDRGFHVKDLQAAAIKQFVARGKKTLIARRATCPPYAGKGRRPAYGLLVRPLARRQQAATAPDHSETWCEDGHGLRAAWWSDLVAADQKPGAPTFHVCVIHDPRWSEPLVLIMNVRLSAAVARAIYHDRWAIEQPPLVAKQLIGAERQWVSEPESCQRVPELALLAGVVLSYLAATQPAHPTGFWDRVPRRTAGRLRRVLQRADYFSGFTFPEGIREKASVTDQLPKGFSARLRHFELEHTAEATTTSPH